jgi:hypothetical protein
MIQNSHFFFLHYVALGFHLCKQAAWSSQSCGFDDNFIYLFVFLCIVGLCKSNSKLIEKLHTLDYLDMVDENITKVDYSSQNIVHLIQSSDHMVS